MIRYRLTVSLRNRYVLWPCVCTTNYHNNYDRINRIEYLHNNRWRDLINNRLLACTCMYTVDPSSDYTEFYNNIIMSMHGKAPDMIL